MGELIEMSTSSKDDNNDQNNWENLIEDKSFHGHNDTFSISNGVFGLSTAADESTEFAEIEKSWDFSNDHGNSNVKNIVSCFRNIISILLRDLNVHVWTTCWILWTILCLHVVDLWLHTTSWTGWSEGANEYNWGKNDNETDKVEHL